MTKLDHYVVLFLGFWIFLILYVRLFFFAGFVISDVTLPLAFVMYIALAGSVYSFIIFDKKKSISFFLPLIAFIIVGLILFAASLLLSYSFDTSWDGQGYHQSAVIALVTGWNPAYQPYIQFKQHLPSQIFAEGYPSALWEIEAAIYALTQRINSAKIVNFAILFASAPLIYILLRKINMGKFLALLLSVCMIIQPVFLIQSMTFMGDGFGYQLFLIAAASLCIIGVSVRSYWAITTFLMAELLLVSTKYSHLPVVLVLGIIFAMIVINRMMNREYRLTLSVKLMTVVFIIVSLIYASIPYFRNQIAHGSLFFPTNIPELIGSVRYNNVPLNLQNENKVSLLLYGIFSKAQPLESGDPRNKENRAELKVPFTFTQTELMNSAGLYNNRVGSGGPLFSGIVLSSFLLVLFLYFRADSKKERYAVYISFFSCFVLCGLSFIAPTPNLLRYVNHLQLLPFVLLIPVYMTFKEKYVKVLSLILFLAIGLNSALYGGAVMYRNYQDTLAANRQFAAMRNSGNLYRVKAQQFYSTYTLLKEQRVPYETVSYLDCGKVQYLFASSTTTQYCITQNKSR